MTMDYAKDIERLFRAVFDRHKKDFGVCDRDIKLAIQDMGKAYKPNPKWERDNKSITTSYNAAGHRCAYLVKYAMIHTGLVCEVLQQAMSMYSVHNSIEDKPTLNLCSLGSGPGTDIVALVLVLGDEFGPKRCQASLIDRSKEWARVFDSIVNELGKKCYGVNKMVSSDCFKCEYLKADLLAFNDKKVYETICDADIITMIKFISAVACKDTRSMVKKIFCAMKPGAMLLFIDNAAGGFYEMLQESARQCGLESVFGPLTHHDYEEPSFNIEICGFTCQYKAKVAAEMWMKKSSTAQNTTNQLPKIFAEGYMSTRLRDNSDLDRGVDEVDYPNQNIQLRPDTPSTERDKCCLIM